MFPLNSNLSYNTGNRRTFHYRPIRSVTYGSETLSNLAPKNWKLTPTHMKSLQSVASFKSAIKELMEAKRLSLSSMPDVYLSGWLRVVDH